MTNVRNNAGKIGLTTPFPLNWKTSLSGQGGRERNWRWFRWGEGQIWQISQTFNLIHIKKLLKNENNKAKFDFN